MSNFMQKPCKHCPFRNDVEPFLTYKVFEEIAYLPDNECNYFHCHNTYSHNDEGEAVYLPETKMCAGFLTLLAQNGYEIPEGFKPSWEICYIDSFDMIQSHPDYNKT